MGHPSQPYVVAAVLAAGRSTRMGEANKLLEQWEGKPLVAHVVDAALACEAFDAVVVVTGHQASNVEAVLGQGVRTIHNPNYFTGMASSLKTAINWADQQGADGLLVLLGDMPLVGTAQMDEICALFAELGNDAIVQATNRGKPGNPVLLPRLLFGELMRIDGDRGARSIIDAHKKRVVPLEIGIAAARDFDTPEAFAKSED